MLPEPTTLLPEMTQADLEELTAWPCTGEGKPLCCCVPSFELKYHMHTNFCGMFILSMPNEWRFSRLYFTRRILSKTFWPVWVTTVRNHTAAEEVLQALTEWSVSLLSLWRNTADTVTSCRHVYDLSTYVCCRCICGYNVYKQVWSLSVGDILY